MLTLVKMFAQQVLGLVVSGLLLWDFGGYVIGMLQKFPALGQMVVSVIVAIVASIALAVNALYIYNATHSTPAKPTR